MEKPKMKQISVTELPERGQFVTVWVYQGQIWSSTYWVENGDFYTHDPVGDTFHEDPFFWDSVEYLDIKFFVGCE